ncbi:MAG: peptidase M4 family protein [Chloroflexi bacterium]|jgi:Zn-dependent metalloprotease|nr:peptidase M4 family protein [Chloroflexota bacterium]
MHTRHPIECIVPPYVLRSIQANGTPAQQVWAMRTLTNSAQFRGQRQVLAEIAPLALAPRVVGKRRMIYDAEHGFILPGRLVRSEGDPPTGDPAVDEAYDGSGHTYDLFSEIFGRDSIDGRGLQLDSTVHYQSSYDNAFWNGQQMVYGDGDEDLPPAERLFNRFTLSLDVIGHELTHGVTQYEARLVYWNQPGALNESFSDVFGILTRQRALNQTAAESDWLIGAELLTSNVNGKAIRSMAEPGTAYNDPILGRDPQPGHMNDYVNTFDDNGGVHINSGIPNRAFYITARELGGFAWERAGQIWYYALRDRLQPQSNFQDAATATYELAGELYGSGSLEQQAVRTGWAEVGITVGEVPQPEPGPVPIPQPVPGKGCLPVAASVLDPVLRLGRRRSS